MSFSEDQGYLPSSVEDLITLVREGFNAQFSTDYDVDTFLGTNAYKFYYALIQRLQEADVKTSEIVLKLQQYFAVTNEIITRPNTTHPGLRDFFTAAGYLISTKPPAEADAGMLWLCVDTDDGADDYADVKLEICNILKDCVPAGIVTMGDETETITLSNDQSFDFSFSLPDRIDIKLRATLTLSSNNQAVILSDEDVVAKVFENVNARYRLGLNFEPQRYLSVLDCPWASSVLLEYSLDGGSMWADDVATLDFDELYTFELADISVVTS